MRFTYWLAASLLMTAACKSQKPLSHTAAYVTADQARLANDLVGNIDYLPFKYIVDGCYARQLYMSLELDTAQIPSSALYIYGNLIPENAVSWGYHVAPLIVTRDASGTESPWILDPGFQKDAMKLDDWIAKSTAQAGSILHGSYYVAGSDYDQAKQTPVTDHSQVISSFDQMPSFQARNMLPACSRNYHYLGNEDGTDVAQKRAKLLSQTKYLANKMTELGKFVAGVADDYKDSTATDDEVALCKGALKGNAQ